MITTQLLRPESIVVVGASNNVHKPGGAILKNLINGGYQGELRAVNPKEKEVQGVPAFADVKDPILWKHWLVQNKLGRLSYSLPDLEKKRMKGRYWKNVSWKL